MDWLTDGRVTIRPVSFQGGAIHRREAESSPFWYRPADAPPGLRRSFLVIVDDGETCPVVEDCVAQATRQFGPPAQRLAYRDAVILVWPRSIAGQIGP
jgi:hypothetical protein